MNIADYNRAAWDHQVASENHWTVPVASEVIDAAKQGQWSVVLTPQKKVPPSWFPDLRGLDVLCLASGGGQQAPIMAAAGANVTSFDNSPWQLDQDRRVAQRDNLKLELELGDMRDLSRFASDSFDLVFNPCSVSFVPELQSVFSQTHRILRADGSLLAGFINPLRFLFDESELENGKLLVRYQLPYADETHLDAGQLDELKSNREPLMFSHSLEDIIAGQLREGLMIRDLIEDVIDDEVLAQYIPSYFATFATKKGLGQSTGRTTFERANYGRLKVTLFHPFRSGEY